MVAEHAVAEVVEVDGVVRKELLYAPNGVHVNEEVARVGGADEHDLQLREIFALVEVPDGKSQPRQHVRVAGIEREFGDQRGSICDAIRGRAISKLLDQRLGRRGGITQLRRRLYKRSRDSDGICRLLPLSMKSDRVCGRLSRLMSAFE